MEIIEEFCPGKVNLFLAVTGRRSDGFHDLVSLMAPLDVGDRLRLTLAPGEGIHLGCNDPGLPCDQRNLVWQAAEAFRRRHPFSGSLRIELEKRLPAGAGLGGGSSDAAGLLRGLNRLLGSPLSGEDLHVLAASLGSDCPFFLQSQAAVARGRGERLSFLPEKVRERLRGTRLLLVKPSFPIATAWAYGAFAKGPEARLSPGQAEDRLADWMAGEAPVTNLLFNNLEPAVFRKYIPLPVLRDRLERSAGATVLMSGSGSTLFSVLERPGQKTRAEAVARDALGEAGWLEQASLAESC